MANENEQTPVTPAEPTPEQIAALEQIRLERSKVELQLREMEQSRTAEEKRNVSLRTREAVTAALSECGVPFLPEASDTVHKLLESYNIGPDGHGFLDGQKTPAVEILKHLGQKHPYLLRGSSGSTPTAAKEPPVRAKSTMSTAEKVAYITAHGEDAFARLPMFEVKTVEVNSKETWGRLTVAQRMELVNKLGADFEKWFAKLPRRNPR